MTNSQSNPLNKDPFAEYSAAIDELRSKFRNRQAGSTALLLHIASTRQELQARLAALDNAANQHLTVPVTELAATLREAIEKTAKKNVQAQMEDKNDVPY